jgi:SAM-dependent methyltransferase
MEAALVTAPIKPVTDDPVVVSRASTVFRQHLVVRHYRRLRGLHPPEQSILRRFHQDLTGKRILDIGVGGGRTTPFLLELSQDYVGIDISSEMISNCRRSFPSARFEICSAADLSRFANREFDVAVFSYNGLDYLGHESRLQALGEIWRVLVPGGLLIFSSHNRAHRSRPPWDIRGLQLHPLRWPRSTMMTLALLPLSIINHLRIKRYERVFEEYALLNDNAHNYGLLTYHIDIRSQVSQLQRLRYAAPEVVGLEGQWIVPRDWAHTERQAWLYYVCRKPAT